ncbi:MAG: hypothetical protein ACRD3C_19565 [Vicinamibacterales bacterium]
MINPLIRVRVWISVIVLSIALAPRASAQQVATSFEQLRGLVKLGDTVYVTDAGGQRTKATIGEVSASSLELFVRQPGQDGHVVSVPQRPLAEGDVKQITLERRDSVWTGTLIGLAAAGVPWLVVCAANDWCYYNEYGGENALRKAAIVTVAMGAGVGALIDASIIKRAIIYQAPGQRSVNIHISPFISKSETGVQASVRF